MLALALTAACAAWFYFAMTQYTMVYADSVVAADVNVSVFRSGTFQPVSLDGNTFKVAILTKTQSYRSYFFLWAGEYTTNDTQKTIYKVEITYGNESGAFPKYLELSGISAFPFSVNLRESLTSKRAIDSWYGKRAAEPEADGPAE